MITKEKIQWITFAPSFSMDGTALQKFSEVSMQLRKFNKEKRDLEQHTALERERKRILSSCDAKDMQYHKLVVALNLLVDVVKQGWLVRIRSGQVQVGRPDCVVHSTNDRSVIRMQLYAQRNEQLRKKSVQSFIKSMEAKRYYKKNYVSIFSLIRDGRELSEKLISVTAIQKDDEKIKRFNDYVKPYLQFIQGDDRCKLTGLRLVDIWRYFRHTWANPYKSVPGRHIMILVRDAATPFHSVIGIASLSSGTVSNMRRDKYIGWTPEMVLQKIKNAKTIKLVDWIINKVDDSIKELYLSDLYRDGKSGISPSDIRNPTEAVINKLILSSQENRNKHYRFVQSGDHPKAESPLSKPIEYWIKQAESLLFRSKRELELANLLKLKIVLNSYFGNKVTKHQLQNFLNSKDCHDVLARIVKLIKAKHVGTLIADLSVCGAVPPYNEILGGKLIAMLVTSPEVVNEYSRRYSKQPSIIASSMSGKPIIRPSNLVFITTTSLFGKRPNQYDRVSIPCSQIVDGSDGVIRYKCLGETEGVGTFHFSEQTVKVMSLLVSGEKNGQRIHNIFGEGANPLMRKIREGLEVLGVSADDFLTHGTPRIIYGISLIKNLTEYLLGISKQPKYFYPKRNTKEISNNITLWWFKRWVINRITHQDVHERIAQHTLIHPIRHGARVELPRTDIEQAMLFDYKFSSKLE